MLFLLSRRTTIARTCIARRGNSREQGYQGQFDLNFVISLQDHEVMKSQDSKVDAGIYGQELMHEFAVYVGVL